MLIQPTNFRALSSAGSLSKRTMASTSRLFETLKKIAQSDTMFGCFAVGFGVLLAASVSSLTSPTVISDPCLLKIRCSDQQTYQKFFSGPADDPNSSLYDPQSYRFFDRFCPQGKDIRNVYMVVKHNCSFMPYANPGILDWQI
jgi:hypothetical protein